MSVTEIAQPVRTVEAEITYLEPGSTVNRRFVAPGVERNTGSYRPYPVSIGDARPDAAEFTLDRNGFQLVRAPSLVTDFFDKDQVERIYPDEVVATLRALVGADEIVPQGWMVRTSGDLQQHIRAAGKGYTHKGGVQPPAGEAHVDMTPDRAERMARMYYDRHFPGGNGYRRFLAVSVWRAFSEPPQDWPLALCDSRTVGADEGTANTLHIVDTLPSEEAMLAHIPGEDEVPAAAIFPYNPAHRWWYYSNMTRDEVLVFKFHDSDQSHAWRTPHTAFFDPTFPDATIRESIEFRLMAYFA